MSLEAIHRMLWRAATSPADLAVFKEKVLDAKCAIQKQIDKGSILTLGLYQWEHHVFLYYETIEQTIYPETLFSESSVYLESWPGEKEIRKWIPLIDIFHFNEPTGLEHWKRKSHVNRRVGQIGFLKPELIPYYLFYHYALQEERSFGGDKYEIIGLSENILFAYREQPEVIETPITISKLSTNVVPEDWADVGITSCFIPWPDIPNVWLRPMNEVISIWQ